MSKIRSPFKDKFGKQLYEGDKCKFPDFDIGSETPFISEGELRLGVDDYWYFDTANTAEIKDYLHADWAKVEKI